MLRSVGVFREIFRTFHDLLSRTKTIRNRKNVDMNCIPREIKGCLALSDWIYYFNPTQADGTPAANGILSDCAGVIVEDADMVNYVMDTFGAGTKARFFTYTNGLQAAVFHRTVGGHIDIYVVFRGTEPNVTDRIVNATLGYTSLPSNPSTVPTPSTGGIAGFFRSSLDSIVELLDDHETSFHSGYNGVLHDASLASPPIVDLHTYVLELAGELEATVWACGHSMGGALASIYGYELAVNSSELGNPLGVKVFTFGAPAFADHDFRVKCNVPAVADKLHITRVANRGDLVLALWPGYIHTANITYHLLPSPTVPFIRYEGYTYNPTTFSAIWCTSIDDHHCYSYWRHMVHYVCPPPAAAAGPGPGNVVPHVNP
jgi:hypothetical protein